MTRTIALDSSSPPDDALADDALPEESPVMPTTSQLEILAICAAVALMAGVLIAVW